MIHVALATNERYLPWAATAALSVLTHTPHTQLHVVHDTSVPRAAETELRALVETNGGALQVHAVPPERTDTLPALDRFGRIVWLRFLLPELLAEEARVVYLDADTFAVSSLEPLWATDMGDSPIGAVANVVDPSLYAHVRALGIEDPRKFFNSGVLLMDLERLRAESLWLRLVDILTEREDRLFWPDQDALNMLFAGRWYALHPRWNAMNSLWDWSAWAREVYGTQVVDEATRRPVILHFEGPAMNKPWHYLSRHPWRDAYRRTLARTPWAATPLEGRSMAGRAAALVPRRWRPRAYGELMRVERRLKRRLGPKTSR
jgi:UDP-glucose/galactose:(glucosyl)LPS alpha-1,2-glucosyl/galactosyltransferase